MRNVGYDDLTKTLVTKKERKKKPNFQAAILLGWRVSVPLFMTRILNNLVLNVRRKKIFAYILRVTKAGAQTLNYLSFMSWLLVSLTNASFISDVLLLS